MFCLSLCSEAIGVPVWPNLFISVSAGPWVVLGGHFGETKHSVRLIENWPWILGSLQVHVFCANPGSAHSPRYLAWCSPPFPGLPCLSSLYPSASEHHCILFPLPAEIGETVHTKSSYNFLCYIVVRQAIHLQIEPLCESLDYILATFWQTCPLRDRDLSPAPLGGSVTDSEGRTVGDIMWVRKN